MGSSRLARFRGSLTHVRPQADDAPLLVFAAIYLPTCWLGGMLLLLGPDWVREAYVYNSGAAIGHLDTDDLISAVALLTAAPAALCGGWVLAGRLHVRPPTGERSPSPLSIPTRLVGVAFGLTIGYLYLRLALAGALADLSAWTDYDDLIAARNAVVDELLFSEFVLAYSVAPLAGGFLVANAVATRPRGRVLVTLAVVVSGLLLLSVLLFQKRPFLVSVLLIAFVVACHRPARDRLLPSTRRGMLIGLAAALAAYAIYLILLVGPVLSQEVDDDGARGRPPAGLHTLAPARSGSTVALEAAFEDGGVGWATEGAFLNGGASIESAAGRAGGALAVDAPTGLNGVTYALGRDTVEGLPLRVSAWVRSAESTPVSLVIGADGMAAGVSTVDTQDEFELVQFFWVPERDGDPASLAVRAAEAGSFVVDDVRVVEEPLARLLVELDSDFEAGLEGWEATGAYLRAPATLGEADGRMGSGMVVEADDSGGGASYAIPVDPRAGQAFIAEAWVRGDEVPVSLRLGSPGRGGNSLRVTPGEAWRKLVLAWTPNRPIRDLAVTLRAEGAGAFAVDDVRVASAPRVQAPSADEQVSSEAFGRSRSGGVTFPSLAELPARTEAEGLFFYALLAPFTRTAGPAIAYPAIYPDRLPFYPIDIGLDVLGFGAAPDDNRTSFETMFPEVPGGQNSVPFAVTLYSQGGLFVALIGSLLVGFVWRAAYDWFATRAPTVAATAVVALLVLFGVFLAGDSVRNALLASYGILWPTLLVGSLPALELARRHLSARAG